MVVQQPQTQTVFSKIASITSLYSKRKKKNILNLIFLGEAVVCLPLIYEAAQGCLLAAVEAAAADDTTTTT